MNLPSPTQIPPTPSLPSLLEQQLLPCPESSISAQIWLFRRALREQKIRKFLSSCSSRHLVKRLVKEANLDQKNWHSQAQLFPHFEAFLKRRLQATSRPLYGGEQTIVLPLDGTHHLTQLQSPTQILHLPPWKFTAEELFPHPSIWKTHTNGYLLVSQPSIVDCHRCHFPTHGIPQPPLLVRPTPANITIGRFGAKQMRQGLPSATLTPFISQHCGNILFLDIGSCGPSGVVQSFTPKRKHVKGDYRSWFRFGSNWTLTWFEAGKILPSENIPTVGENTPPPPKEQIFHALYGHPLGMAT